MMKQLVMFLIVVLIIASCNNDGPQKVKIGENEKIVASFVNGNPQIVREFEEVDGAIVAVYEKEYYNDGNILKEGSILNNKRHGNWKTYYQNGNIWNEGWFYEGLRHDTINSYYTNGNLKYRAIYKNGQKTGVWQFFDEEGNFTENIVYMQPGEIRTDSLTVVQ